MFLKKIILNGFKSFADKVTLSFDSGITGIVGPNGAGKSNIIDAVRWLMGEQSTKHLRGQVATDIIFAGSEKRKPLGMAEVTLVFDNNDESQFCPPEYRHESEISLTRRLYTDAEREYLINRRPARLKDIITFFATTGLGGRSYSMIQQGQVDRILNAKPEDVREIIEEAAGTKIFKIRREEALKKLQQTQENLARIEDIVNELDHQEKSLLNQVDKAVEWKELTKNLKNEELNLYAHQFRIHTEKLNQIQKRQNEEMQHEAEFMATLAKYEARQTELQNLLAKTDPDLEKLREQITNCREEILRLEGQILKQIESAENGERRLEDLAKEIKDDNENLKTIEQQIDSATEELSLAQAKSNAFKKTIEHFQSQLDEVDESAQIFQNKVDDYKLEIQNIDRLLEKNSLRCESLNKDQEKCNEQISQVNERLGLLKKELEKAEHELQAVQKKVAEQKSGLDKDLQEKTDLEASIDQRFETLENVAKKRDQCREHYLNNKAKHNSLEEVLNQASSVASSLTTLRELNPQVEELTFGMLTDFIGFNKNADELSQKTRTSFEKWAERIVVKDFNNFNELVRLAHQTDIADLPVTILSQWQKSPLKQIQKWANQAEAHPLHHYLKLNQPDKNLGEILDRLYFWPALQLSAQDLDSIPSGIVVFTAQGVICYRHDDFFISSQSQKGILTRRIELDELSSQIQILQNELAQTQAEYDELNLLQQEQRAKLAALNEKLQNQNQDVLAVLSEAQAVTQQKQHKEQLLNDALNQLNSLENSKHQSLRELEELGQNRISLADEREQALKDLQAIEEEASTIEDRHSEIEKEQQKVKVDLAKSESRAHTLQESYNQIKQQLERLQSLLTRKYQEQSNLHGTIAESKELQKKHKLEIETLVQRQRDLEQQFAEKREENSEIIEELRAVDSKLKEFRQHQNEIQRKNNEYNLEMERIKFALENFTLQTQEKYHLDLNNYQFEFNPDLNIESKNKAVHRLRQKLENLGPVNMMALEEYEELKTRKQFITVQRDEVLKSIEVLLEAIKEIEDSSSNKFLNTFDTINIEFANLFPILFPGGEARLDLTQPDDPLNSGVEIMVRMPGKKTAKLNLFSGGEKALTAIALILALLKTKPTPFCFLDEVDAALDEANVGRFNRVLDALSERFQFIIITHNRRTMEILDTLYGVIMQEPGVSKIVGVDLNKDIPDHLKKAFKEQQPQTDGDRPIEGASAH